MAQIHNQESVKRLELSGVRQAYKRINERQHLWLLFKFIFQECNQVTVLGIYFVKCLIFKWIFNQKWKIHSLFTHNYCKEAVGEVFDPKNT